MASLKSIFTDNWDSTNTLLPTIVEAPMFGKYMYDRIIYIEQTEKTEDYMDIVSSSYYTPESHDAFLCIAGSSTLADAESITDEIRRICSQFTPSGNDKILEWEGGSWVYDTSYWFECNFVIFKRKSGVTLAGI